MARPFVHLHNHTVFSLLDGQSKLKPMVSRVKELGMDSVAITDHGAMFGVMDFYLECRKQGVKPIVGMEAYVAPGGHQNRSGRDEQGNFHLLLLAKNNTGYRNLCKLATIASLQGYYYRPRIDHDLLREYSEGLIGTTTCLSSEVCRALLANDYEKALNTAAMYRDIFGAENYFVELQDHHLADDQVVLDGLLKISQDLNLPLLCTNDSHYLCKEDHDAHDVLLCIQTNSLVSQTDRLKFDTREFYLKTPDEMWELFNRHPEAYENSLRISEMCDVNLESERADLPDPLVPEGVDLSTHLRDLAERGLRERVERDLDAAQERLNYELGVIERTGFEKYFLLVREFAEYARNKHVYFGVRGSAAGSLVSYCLGITDVDPLEYGLTFERFLNPERVTMPDIDMDFEDARRDEVIEYVRQRFGEDHVAQIITFGTLGAKAAMRDAGRALGRPLAEVDRLCKLIPMLPGWTIERALADVPDFKQAYSSDPSARELIDTAAKVEGALRNPGVHAAGVVISQKPLDECVPLTRHKDGFILTQYPMGVLEYAGLLKMDFLGLSNLTVLSKAIENIRASGKGDLNINSIPFDDQKTYELLGRGETIGVFQLEGDGMRRYVIQLKPQSIQELAAMVALYRPGPMNHIPEYIESKFGKRKAKYLDSRMEPILRETYGVIVYQDQVLQLVQALAGFTLGKADILRRAMGKKDKKLLDSMRVEFFEGCKGNGVEESTAKQIWNLLEPFADYAFNKAHAVCYAILAYQTAFLKANFPVEYMAALLAVYRDKEDKIVQCIEECRRMGIDVLPPDVNRSSIEFTIEGKGIRFGLAAIKGIGDSAVSGVLAAREEGPFVHLFDLALRTRTHGGVNRATLEALIRSGATDSIDPNRAKLLNAVDTALAYADQMARDRLAGQADLFGAAGGGPSEPRFPALPDTDPPSRHELLNMEKSVMGLYVSDHPLRGFDQVIMDVATHNASVLAELSSETEVTLAGVIVSYRERRTKQNEAYAAFTLEDLTGQVPVFVFPKRFQELRSELGKDKTVIVRGFARRREGGPSDGALEVIAHSVSPLSSESANATVLDDDAVGVISLKVLAATKEELQRAKQLILDNPGEFVLRIEVMTPTSNGSGNSNGNGNGHGRVRPMTTYVSPYRVSDGPWIQNLRRTLSSCFVIVNRSRLRPNPGTGQPFVG
ncbi:MAG: DNA polymerase III subunit alpha [Armatimonadetes bacterium]|nr:DNA polymerase III subunit alpha [Armatimonadota bacterium]NOG93574.1 DNA polymerase III subunit alpha [Armatimonadota bacterium]